MFMCIYVVGDYIGLCAYMLLVSIYVYMHIYCWWLYMFMCIYVVGDYIGLCAYMLLVSIYVYMHICCWWLYMFMCIYVVGEYICLCAYMLLVNFSYMLLVLNCWFKHVLEYVGVDFFDLSDGGLMPYRSYLTFSDGGLCPDGTTCILHCRGDVLLRWVVVVIAL